ncbi:MAG: TldD/PmbA family protein [Nitrososphaeria archaeon]|nr:TldD/PmbA family protein [Conexivisphaerales archaeon]
MLAEDLAHFAVEQASKLGFEYSEARVQRDTFITVSLNSGIPDVPLKGEFYGIGIRAIYKGAMGFSSTNVLTKDSVTNVLENLKRTLESIAATKINEKVRMSEEDALTANWSVDERTPFEDVNLDWFLKKTRELDELTKNESKIKQRLIRLSGSLQLKYFVNSEGTMVRSRVPRYLLTAFITAYDASDIAQRFIEIGGSGGPEVLDRIKAYEKFNEEIRAITNIVGRRKSVKEDVYDVVVGPEVAGIMAHESIGHPFEADRVRGREGAQGGESYLREIKSGKIGSAEANISDDPTIPFSYGYFLFDEEGVKARKKELVKEGAVNELLHNRETAGEAGINSNASARASNYSVEPIIRMSNTFVEPGDWTFEEIVKEVKDGLFIKSFMEWNIDDRRLNQRYVGFEAYRISNSEIQEPVKGIIIETTTLNLWSKLYARSRELEFSAATCGKGDPEQGVPVWTGGPYLLFKGLNLKVR